jgi:hypothetical protein
VARLPPTFNFESNDELTIEDLILQLERMYVDIANAVNSKPDLYVRAVDGQTTDTFLAQGSININSTTRKVEMLTQFTSPVSVVWTTLS